MIIHGVELHGEDDRVVVNARKNGTFEPESMAAWKAALKPGQVAIDVGAYSGLYAIYAAKAGCTAVAYEPNPTMFSRLRDNVVRNRVPVECHRIALSDVDGVSEFWMTHDITSAGRFAVRKNGFRIEVTTRKLIEPRKVCAIKCDVEGAELKVMIGATGIIRRDRPVIIAEALKKKERDELTAYVCALGYSYVAADGRNLVFLPK